MQTSGQGYGELPTTKTLTAMISFYRESDLSKSTHFSIILYVPFQNQAYNLWSVQQAMQHVKECVSDILYIGTSNMQWCSVLLDLLLCIVLFSYQATVHYTVYTTFGLTVTCDKYAQ